MNKKCTAWLSQGIETLIAEKNANPPGPGDLDFDVVIIGSGYGGSIAAAFLANQRNAEGKRLRVCVLERGREYLPGMFPSSLSTLAGHARITTPWSHRVQGNREGLFDIRLNKDINALVANGLGGGSLINAGVMETPHPNVFDHRWPKQLRSLDELEKYFESAREKLGAQREGAPNTIQCHPDHRKNPLAKHSSLSALCSGSKEGTFRDASITVAMSDQANNSQVRMSQCTLCGDCATGCNFGAKDSLDLNMLVEAKRCNASLYTGATVLGVIQIDGRNAWGVDLVHTLPELAEREQKPTRISARRVVIAAGTFGSTEILLRSRHLGLRVSDKLGQGFSGNGDSMVVGFRQNRLANAVADETVAHRSRHIGPTITGIIDRRFEKNPQPVIIEEMAVPAPMRRLFEEIYTSTNCLHKMAETDRTVQVKGNPDPDPFAVDPTSIKHSSLYAVMGDDGAQGEMTLRRDFDGHCDSALKVAWGELGKHPLFASQVAQLESLAKTSGSGGRILPNPAWRPLPAAMGVLAGNHHGPQLTVHPLGGCAMGDCADSGVVDHCGRVFADNSKDPSEVYDGLVVLDGAIMPCALGTNPALTIAALASRAVEHLARDWGLVEIPAVISTAGSEKPSYGERPRYSDEPVVAPIRPTYMEFAERLRGPIELDIEGGRKEYMAEITLFFDEKPLQSLIATDNQSDTPPQPICRKEAGDISTQFLPKHSLQVATSKKSLPSFKRSQLRVIPMRDWEKIATLHYSGRQLEEALSRASILTAPVEGRLDIMARNPSTYCSRTLGAISAWVRNRGLRDIWQAIFPLPHEREARSKETFPRKLNKAIRTAKLWWKMASHAGEIRTFEYSLKTGEACSSAVPLANYSGRAIRGTKRIVYRRRGNPLRQMMEVEVSEFLGKTGFDSAPVLSLVPEFLARKGLPLFRITRQHDTPQALADLFSLSAYFGRLMASIHLLSFRKPDLPPPRRIDRLPGRVPGLPPPEYVEIPIDESSRGQGRQQANCRLTRYPRPGSELPPVILIHGYSASGTTFAHPAVQPNLAGYLWSRGRDVWVLDLRSSCGLPTATVNYSFEELAEADIPLAIDYVCSHTAEPSVDIVAHCMGAAMFSMAVLGEPWVSPVKPGTRYLNQRELMPKRIRRAVLSQVGPLVSLAPANVFRSYLFSYLKHFLPLDNYSFKPTEGGSLFDELLDRLLTALPYSDREFDLENPITPWRRTPYTTARHRMDLLYGRTFSLDNLSANALAHIDDLFGPFNVDSATQVAHFARSQCITDHGGNNPFVSRQQLRRNWTFPTLSLHGAQNGLADVSTLGRMSEILRDAGCQLECRQFYGLGHQDSLVGHYSMPFFESVETFFRAPCADLKEACQAQADSICVQVPWTGPVIGPVQKGSAELELPLSFGSNPSLSNPRLIVAIPLKPGEDSAQPNRHSLDVINCSCGGAAASVHLCPTPLNGWIKYRLPLTAEAKAASSVLVLLVYDEPPALDNALYGRGEEQHQRFRSFTHIQLNDMTRPGTARRTHWPERGLAKAIENCLSSGPESLHPGIVSLVQDNSDSHLCFALGSCQYPPGLLDQKTGFRSYERLAAHLDNPASLNKPQMLVLTGDQIYVDPTAGLFDPTSRDERHLHPYRRFYRAGHVRSVLRRLPAYMMLDDHEIENNWGPVAGSESNTSVMKTGREHYLNFQRGPHQQPQSRGLWYEFSFRGFDFFVVDTRTERAQRSASAEQTQSLLGEAQTNDLEHWLDKQAAKSGEQRARPRFVICPAMPLPRRTSAPADGSGPGAIRHDGWEGYPATLHWLLQKVSNLGLSNLVFLSGDAHLSCVAEIEELSSEHKNTFWSVHGSPVYAPLPFANSQTADFRRNEQFSIPGNEVGTKLSYKVSTEFAEAGDGFTLLRVHKRGQRWRIEVSFDREPGVSDPISLQHRQPQCDCAPSNF